MEQFHWVENFHFTGRQRWKQGFWQGYFQVGTRRPVSCTEAEGFPCWIIFPNRVYRQLNKFQGNNLSKLGKLDIFIFFFSYQKGEISPSLSACLHQTYQWTFWMDIRPFWRKREILCEKKHVKCLSVISLEIDGKVLFDRLRLNFEKWVSFLIPLVWGQSIAVINIFLKWLKEDSKIRDSKTL